MRNARLRELAGRRDAGAEVDRARDDQAQRGGAAVRLELEHVLAGVRGGGGEEQHEAGVDRRAGAIAKGREVATRGGGTAPTSALAIAALRGPDTRTMPMPPRPGGVAMAAIVSTGDIRQA